MSDEEIINQLTLKNNKSIEQLNSFVNSHSKTPLSTPVNNVLYDYIITNKPGKTIHFKLPTATNRETEQHKWG